jgi:GGDEF domain-containing protein
MAAVRREAARHDRYGRSASILLIDVAGAAEDVAADRLAHRLADAIRAEARETDRAVRIAPLAFRLLMPETGAAAAQTAAERLEQAFRSSVDGTMPGIDMRIEIATVARAGSLEDALGDAERRMVERTDRAAVD